MTGSGGTGSLSYSVSPSLPTGLSIASGSGAITGTPTSVASAATYTVTVTDANSATATATFSLAVVAGPTATQAIAATVLTQNKAATSFTPVTGSGGTTPLSYAVSPSLPNGLSMASGTGAITGTATAISAATTYTVTVTDANSATATATFSLTVISAVVSHPGGGVEDADAEQGGGVVHARDGLGWYAAAHIYGIARSSDRSVDGLGHRCDHRDPDRRRFGSDLYGDGDRRQQRHGDGDVLVDGELGGPPPLKRSRRRR